jgi:hypothetical protein
MRLAALPLLAVGLSACGDVLYLEGAVNQLCQKLPAQSFRTPALPQTLPEGVAPPPAITIERRFDFDITAQLPGELSAAQLTIGLDRMTLTARGPVDLRMVQAAKVTLEPPVASTLPSKVVLEAAQASASAIRFDGADLELAPYLESGVLSYTVALTASTAEMPASMNELSADVDACANVAVRWNYAR